MTLREIFRGYPEQLIGGHRKTFWAVMFTPTVVAVAGLAALGAGDRHLSNVLCDVAVGLDVVWLAALFALIWRKRRQR